MSVGSSQGGTWRRTGLLGFRIAVLALAASPASGQEEEPSGASEPVNYARSGIYVGLGGVYAVEQFASPIEGGNSLGWTPWLGYRFHPRGAIETQIEAIIGFEFDDPRVSGEFANELGPTIWTVNGKFFFLTERVQPYAVVGMGLLLPGLNNPYFRTPADGVPGSSTIDTAFTMKFGGGVDYYLTENLAIAVNAVYTMPIGSGLASKIPYVSIGWGLQYYFRFSE